MTFFKKDKSRVYFCMCHYISRHKINFWESICNHCAMAHWIATNGLQVCCESLKSVRGQDLGQDLRVRILVGSLVVVSFWQYKGALSIVRKHLLLTSWWATWIQKWLQMCFLKPMLAVANFRERKGYGLAKKNQGGILIDTVALRFHPLQLRTFPLPPTPQTAQGLPQGKHLACPGTGQMLWWQMQGVTGHLQQLL